MAGIKSPADSAQARFLGASVVAVHSTSPPNITWPLEGLTKDIRECIAIDIDICAGLIRELALALPVFKLSAVS